MYESFEGGFPSGWPVQLADTTSDGYRWGNAGTLSSPGWTIDVGTNFLATNDDACDCNKSEDRLVLPPMSFDTVAAVRLEANVYFNKGTFGGGTESAKIQASLDGVTWNTLTTLNGDADWQAILVDLTTYAGLPVVYLSFLYDDGGGWTFGLAVDDVRVLEPPAKDLKLTRLAPDLAYQVEGLVSFSGTLRNMGRDTLSSFDVSYSVGGSSPVTAMVSGLTLLPLDTLLFVHPDPWLATADSMVQSIVVTLSNPDGMADAQPDDNSLVLNTRFLSVDWVTDRTVLLEHFTSTNSGSAAALNPDYYSLVQSMGVLATNVSYHVWWPYTTDPFYNAYPSAAEERAPFYSVSLLPEVRVDGLFLDPIDELDAEVIIRRANRPALFDMSLSLTPDSGFYRIEVLAECLAPYWNDQVRLYVMALERYVPGPNTDPFASPEDDFRDVVRIMFPNADGVSLDDPGIGITYSQAWSWNPSSAWDDLSDATLVAFIQDPISQEVLQAAVYNSPPLGWSNETTVSVPSFLVGPNPAARTLEVALNLPSEMPQSWAVIDLTGSPKMQGLWPNGSQSLLLDVAQLSAGAYALVLRMPFGGRAARIWIKH